MEGASYKSGFLDIQNVQWYCCIPFYLKDTWAHVVVTILATCRYGFFEERQTVFLFKEKSPIITQTTEMERSQGPYTSNTGEL